MNDFKIGDRVEKHGVTGTIAFGVGGEIAPVNWDDGRTTFAKTKTLTLIKSPKNEWKESVIEELVAWCILTESDEGDPRAAVKKLCEWERTVALDPKVSEPAAKLHAELAAAKAESERMSEVVDGVKYAITMLSELRASDISERTERELAAIQHHLMGTITDEAGKAMG